MAHELTPNCIKTIANALPCSSPTVQVVNVASTAINGNSDYVLTLSDGSHTLEALLPTQLNLLVAPGQVQGKSIIQLTEYSCNTLAGMRIIVILNLYIVSGSVEQLIGEPTAFSIPSTPMFGTGYTGAATSSLAPFRPPASGLAFGKSPTDPPSEVTPIKSMNCYLPAWTIRAQCTHKSEVRHWQTHVSTGKLCTVYLADESGEIQATMFNDAVDQLFPTFEVGKVFRVSNGKIKFANAKFSTIKHECELVLDTMTTVVPSYEKVETDSMHSFTTIDQVFQSSPNTVLDVIGVVKSAEPLAQLSTATRGSMSKRTVVICDESTSQLLSLTLWEKAAEGLPEDVGVAHHVLACKSARTTNFNGVQLSSTTQSVVEYLHRPVSLKVADGFWKRSSM